MFVGSIQREHSKYNSLHAIAHVLHLNVLNARTIIRIGSKPWYTINGPRLEHQCATRTLVQGILDFGTWNNPITLTCLVYVFD